MSRDPWDAGHDADANHAASPERNAGDRPWRPGPLQFGIGGLLTLTTIVAIVFGALRWLGISTRAAWIVLLVMVVGGIAAVAMVWAIAQTTDRRNDDSNHR